MIKQDVKSNKIAYKASFRCITDEWLGCQYFFCLEDILINIIFFVYYFHWHCGDTAHRPWAICKHVT